MRTAELIGDALDWAVAICEGVSLEEGLTDDEKCSTDWAQGGPIIERELIAIEYAVMIDGESLWTARSKKTAEPRGALGQTPLVAAMRCYIRSKLGDEVKVPEQYNGGS